MNAQGAPHTPDWYLAHLELEMDRFASALVGADLDAPVPACGDWNVARLAEHLGQIHRWANFCATHARPPSEDEAAALESYDPDDVAGWYRRCADELLATLRELDPGAATWHPFPVERVAAVWPRRQAHEVAVHRWDLESALGDPSPIDPELASDGIDEYFEIAIPRLLVRGRITVPESSFHVHCTDVEGEWLVWSDGGEFRMKRAHEKGDAALRGPAEVILLELWGRDHGRSDELGPVGDESALTAWTTLAGM